MSHNFDLSIDDSSVFFFLVFEVDTVKGISDISTLVGDFDFTRITIRFFEIFMRYDLE